MSLLNEKTVTDIQKMSVFNCKNKIKVAIEDVAEGGYDKMLARLYGTGFN